MIVEVKMTLNVNTHPRKWLEAIMRDNVLELDEYVVEMTFEDKPDNYSPLPRRQKNDDSNKDN